MNEKIREALHEEREFLRKRIRSDGYRIADIDQEILQFDIAASDIPGDPGWYYVPEVGAMARLSLDPESGYSWDDGWGNAWEDLLELKGAVKVEIPDDTA